MKTKVALVYQILNGMRREYPTRIRVVEIAFRFTEDQLNLILRRVYEEQAHK